MEIEHHQKPENLIFYFDQLLDVSLGKEHKALFRRAELKTLVDFHGNEVLSQTQVALSFSLTFSLVWLSLCPQKCRLEKEES